MTYLRMSDLDLAGKRVLIRQDLNVPLDGDGRITSTTRIEASLPTIRAALEQGAAVMVMSHLGRPKEGVVSDEHSLRPVADYLTLKLAQEVPLVSNWIDGVKVAPGQVALCENVRFLKGEKANDDALAQKMAALCDVYVMDAFGTAHRAQTSTHGVAKFAPIACAGPLLAAELEALGKSLGGPARPLVVIVGGSKVSTKLELLESLANVADRLILGGGIANTFLAAAGHPVGKSLHEADLIPAAKSIEKKMAERGAAIPMPVDVVTATEFSAEAHAETRPVAEVEDDEMILDVGPQTREEIAHIIKTAGTVVWNGPLGVFEIDQFGGGSEALARAIAASDAFSLAGGGDTLAAIEKYAVGDDISYISTGGGAFLEFLEGKKLPAVEILEQRAAG